MCSRREPAASAHVPRFRRQITRLLYPMLLLVKCAAAQSVEGTVLDAATGAGAVGVKVELLRQTTPFYETSTDEAGHFRFDNIREADYAIRYQSPSYWLTAGPTDYRPFHVGTGDPVKLEQRLMPFSKISGRVVDSDGNGIPEARVTVSGPGIVINGRTYLRTSWGQGGGPALSAGMIMSHRGTTDAHGGFEVGVMPGTYTLSVLPPVKWKTSAPDTAWRRVYYPGVTDPGAAADIVVPPAGGMSGIEMKLIEVPTHAVRGVVVNPNGTPAAKANITAFDDVGGRLVAQTGVDGAFEFPSVPEGEWAFTAELGEQVKLRATEWIEIPSHDVAGVKLRLAPALLLRGHVQVEAAKDAPRLQPGPFILTLCGGHTQTEGFVLIGGRPAEPDSRGAFVLEDMYPGRYCLSSMLQPPAPPYYLDAIRIGGKDLLTQDVEIAFDAEVTVVYRADSGSVIGKAENCASGGILLVPRDPARRRPVLLQSGACNANDRYEVRGVRPGDYYAVGYAGNGPAARVDDLTLATAIKLTVRPGESTTADVPVVTRPVF